METPKTDKVIESDDMEQVQNIIEVTRFVKTYSDVQSIGDVKDFHKKIMKTLNTSIMEYKDAILEGFRLDEPELDLKHSEILIRTIQLWGILLEEDHTAHLKPALVRVTNLIFFELKNLFEDIVNRWMKFYLREFWVMLELGVTEFTTMDKFVYHMLVDHSNKVKTKSPLLTSFYVDFIQCTSRKVGERIMAAGFEFKKRVKDALAIMNNGAQQCIAMTPYVARYELSRLKIRVEKITKDVQKLWYLHYYANNEAMEKFFKGLYENVEINPIIDFDKPATRDEVYTPLARSAEDEKILRAMMSSDNIDRPKDQPHDEPTAKEQEATQKLNLSVLDKQNTLSLAGPEEQDINEFFLSHPDINQLRKDKMKKLLASLADKEVKDVKYFVNEQGILAKFVKFKGEEEYFLIRNDDEGHKVISKNINNGWFQVDKTYVMSGTNATDILSANAINLQMSAQAMSGAFLMCGTGAVGSFLFKLVQGKESVHKISKELARDAGSSVALTVLMSTMPFVAISIASVLGVKTINDLRNNEFISDHKKVTIISEVLARAGTKTAFAVGGAVVGQSLIPVPILGAFIGGVVGGFTASALCSSYDSLIAKRVSLELFCFYCILQLQLRGRYQKELFKMEELLAQKDKSRLVH